MTSGAGRGDLILPLAELSIKTTTPRVSNPNKTRISEF